MSLHLCIEPVQSAQERMVFPIVLRLEKEKILTLSM